MLCVKKNDWIYLIIPDQKNDLSIFNSKYFPIQITSIFRSQKSLDSNTAFMSFNFLRKHFTLDHTIAQIELKTEYPFDIDKIIMRIIKKIDVPFVVHTWLHIYQNIYHDMQMIKAIVYFAISLVIIIACFSIGSISFTLISKKTKEIAILKSMGADNFFIQCIFFYYGFRFILRGVLMGLLMGIITILSFTKILSLVEKIQNTQEVVDNLYIKDFLLLELNTSDIVIIFILTIIISVLINLYPAYYASTVSPSKILKES